MSIIIFQISNFEKASEDNWKARQDTLPNSEAKQEFPSQPFTFVLNWKPEQINNKYISLIINVSSFVGGASSISDMTTFNFDIENNKILTLQDILKNDKNYLKTISDYSREQLQSTINPTNDSNLQDMIISGTEPKSENFENFTFNEYSINIYFKKYQVAPGSSGEQEIKYYFTDSTTQIANPASVNCKNNGGTLSIVKDGKGDEYGLCYFDDNRACEEWAMMRGDCPVGGRNCLFSL